MTIANAGFALVLLALVGAPAAAQDQLMAGGTQVEMKGAGNKDMGKAMLNEGSRGVVISFDLIGLTPGWHAVHFHAKADCSAADFTSAGGHVHKGEASVHGLLNKDASDSGDLPNIFAGADGKAKAEIYTTYVSVRTSDDGRPALFDADGSAIVVHAAKDDYKSQPIGNAGARVACGVIK